MIDVIVVGSGPCGVNAAYPLVEAGHRVVLLDIGNEDPTYGPLIPAKPFSEIRREETDQHRFFLGDEFEGVPFGEARVGAQLTPPRLHILQDAGELMPIDSDDFQGVESLALGGLGAGWGAGVFPFTQKELRDIPIEREDLARHYEQVAARIGVAGDRDDLMPFLGDLSSMFPSPEIDTNADTVFSRYQQKRSSFNSRGFYMGRTRLAVCTKPHRGRGPAGYFDMDFWADSDRSVYRPKWTLEELKAYTNFTYINRRLVLSFSEKYSGVEVTARNLPSGESETHTARYVILAAGTLSTARIVLRSLGKYETPVPILCNPYTYVPMLNLGMLGRPAKDRRFSLAQLTAIFEPPDGDCGTVQVQYFSYRSLLTFKLLKEAPLPFREGLRLMRMLIPLFGILGVNYDDAPTESRYCVLHQAPEGLPDRLEVHGGLSDKEEAIRDKYDRIMVRFFRELGCLPIKKIKLPQGSSIHYAGTVPMSAEDKPLTCDADCRLRGTSNVFVADGSVLAYLPAKGLTFTTMAIANRVGTHVLKAL